MGPIIWQVFYYRIDDARQPLNRIVPLPSNLINFYRVVIILRLIILGFFFQYRVTHPVAEAYALWLTSVICEIWFALSWLLDQFPKWTPINRETYLDRLSLRFVTCFFVLINFSSVSIDTQIIWRLNFLFTDMTEMENLHS